MYAAHAEQVDFITASAAQVAGRRFDGELLQAVGDKTDAGAVDVASGSPDWNALLLAAVFTVRSAPPASGDGPAPQDLGYADGDVPWF